MRIPRVALIIVPTMLCVLVMPALADPYDPNAISATYGGYYGGHANVDRIAGYYGGSGGEFTLYNSTLSTSAYSALAKNVGYLTHGLTSFQTFCLETNEYVMGPYWSEITVNTTNVNEGTGQIGALGSGSHAVRGGVDKNLGDNLEVGTAYLYTQFATGVLNNYDYTGAGRSASALALQQAIWALEGEISSASLTGQASTWYNAALDCRWTGIGNVRVLNLWTANSAPSNWQDQLYLVPAPGAILLVAVGLGLVGWLKRRIA